MPLLRGISSALAQSNTVLHHRLGEADRLLQEGIQHTQSSRFQEALQALETALQIYRENGVREAFPRVSRAREGAALADLGNIYRNLGQYQRAIDYHQEALAIFREVGNLAGEGRVLGNLGNIYLNLGQYQRAITVYQQSLNMAREIGDRAEEGRVLGNLGLAYRNLGLYQQALNISQQSLAIAREGDNRTREVAALGDLGVIYRNLGQYQQSIAFHEQSLRLAREMGDRGGEVAALGNLGSAYFSIGQYPQAITLYEQSLELAREIGDRDGEGIILGNLGTIYSELGQYQQGLTFTQQRLAIAREIGDRNGEGVALNNLGTIHRDVGQYQQAIYYYQQGLDIFRETGNRARESNVLSNLGTAHNSLGHYQQALDLYQQSLAIAREIGDRAGEGDTLGNLGITYNRLGHYQQAIDFYQQSLTIAREIGDRAGEGSDLNNLGVALLNSENAVQSEHVLFEAVDVLESLRARALLAEQRISLIETQLDTFQTLQRALVAQDKVTEALEVAERGRARVFLEELAFRLGSESEASFVEVSVPNIEQIRQIAREQNATLVEYSIIRGEELYIWVVRPTGTITFRSVSLDRQSLNIANLVESTRHSMGILRSSLLAWGEPETTATINLNEQLQQLHRVLIEPIADLLPTDPNKSVIFIPQDELFLVPFAALQDADGTYLIDRHTILTAPAIQVLASTQAHQEQVELANLQDALVVGDPTMPLLSIVPGEPPTYLNPLPGAEQEAQEIAEILDTQPLLGIAATKSTVVAQMSQARIIHLATHGLLDEFQGLNGGVVLAADGTGEFNDGLLTAAEIAQMELNAEMVVLSACNTGQGRITGDGVIGLSRSLILAGVPTVVVSLWAVPDDPTGELMVEFYRQLEVTDNKAQALRQAMIKIREIYSDPVDWAAFTIIGEAD